MYIYIYIYISRPGPEDGPGDQPGRRLRLLAEALRPNIINYIYIYTHICI